MNNTLSSNDHFFVTVYFEVVENRLQVMQYSDPQGREMQRTIPRSIDMSLQEMEDCLKDGTVRIDLRNGSASPPQLLTFPRQLGCETAAYVPILEEGQLRGLVLIGGRSEQEVTEDVVNAFARTIRLTASSLKPAVSRTEPQNQHRPAEVVALNTLA